MKFYRDFVEDYSDEIVQKMNSEYSKLSSMDNCRVGVCERNEFFNKKQLNILYEKLSRCEQSLKSLMSIDKGNDFLKDALMSTQNNTVSIATCCDPCEPDCLYYSRGCLDIRRCCEDYCNCEWDVINKILFLLTIKNLPISHLILFDMLRCRTSILQKVYSTYYSNN